MKTSVDDDEMRPGYDFSGGVRGKHHKAYVEGTNLVPPDPDIAEVFEDSESVNHALRMLLALAEKEVKGKLPTS